jgi:hypothetical protein
MKYTKLTPNLVVRDVAAALRFYQSVLGFQPGMTVPDAPPYVFASVTNGDTVEIFFNDQKAVGEDYPPLAKDPLAARSLYFWNAKASKKFSRAWRSPAQRSCCRSKPSSTECANSPSRTPKAGSSPSPNASSKRGELKSIPPGAPGSRPFFGR